MSTIRLVEEKFMADGSVIMTFEGVSPAEADAFAELGKKAAITNFTRCLEDRILSNDQNALPATFELPSREECISLGINQILISVMNWTEDERRKYSEESNMPAV